MDRITVIGLAVLVVFFTTLLVTLTEDQVANAFIYEKQMCEQLLDDVMTDTDTVVFDRRCGAVLGWEPPYDGYGSR